MIYKMDSCKEDSPVGRANTVLIFKNGHENRAVVTSVIARVSDQETRLRFLGPVSFTEKTINHINDVVLPLVDNLFENLKLPKQNYEISIINLSVASANDIGLTISGFSADPAIFSALISTRLGIPISNNIVFTGHIASIDGDIRMVNSLPEKLKGITECSNIETVIHPEPSGDNSLKIFSPEMMDSIESALAEAKKHIYPIGVSDISELLKATFSEDSIVLASLHHGFFLKRTRHSDQKTAMGRAVTLFKKGNIKRFWSAMEHWLMEGQAAEVKELLRAFTEYQHKKNRYPKGFGKRLTRLIHSLPHRLLQKKIDFPLLPFRVVKKISQFANDDQAEDVLLLMKAISGENQGQVDSLKTNLRSKYCNKKDQENLLFEYILSEIGRDTLIKTIDLPIDSARASFCLDKIIIHHHDELTQTIAAFYQHLLRHTQKGLDTIDRDVAGMEGTALLERSYARYGGFSAALQEAKHAGQGGLRFILDTLTDRFKQEEREKHINYVLKTTIDPLEWEEKVRFIAWFLKHLGPNLPQEILNQPPIRYATHYETIVKAYADSMNTIKTAFRTF